MYIELIVQMTKTPLSGSEKVIHNFSLSKNHTSINNKQKQIIW